MVAAFWRRLIRRISQRTRTKEELRRSEANLAEAQRLSHTGSWAWDISTGDLFWSEEHFRIFGLDPEKVTPSYPMFLQWIHPEDRSRVKRGFEQAVRERNNFEAGYRVVRPDGVTRHIQCLAHPVLDESGNVAEYVGTIIDATERKQAEENLRESEERFRRYFDLGLVGLAITSPTKGIAEVNDKMCEILGYERGELLELDWAQLTHPDDLAGDITNFNRVLAGEIDGYSMDKRWVRKDGQVIDTTIAVKCVRRADGSVDYFVAMMQDITQRKRAEKALYRAHEELEQRVIERTGELSVANEALKTEVIEHEHTEALLRAANQRIEVILDSMTDRFFALDKAWRFTYFNKHAEAQLEALGKNPASLIGKVLWEVFPDPPLEEALRRSMRERVVVTDDHYYPPLEEWQENRIYPSSDAGLAVIQRDITERKQAEEEAWRLASLVENSGDFIGFASLEGQPLFVNPAGQRMVGLDGDQHVRRTKMLDYSIEQDREKLKSQALPAVMRTGQWEGEMRFKHFKTGAAIPLLQNIFLVKEPDSDQPVALGTIGRDITARKRAEEQLRRSETYLAEGQRLSNTGSWAWNVATGEIFWSEEYFRIFGLDRDKGMPTYPMFLQAIHPEDRLFVKETVEDRARERLDFEVKCRIIRPGGAIRHIHSLAHPFFDESGELTEYVGTVMDVTERKESEARIKSLASYNYDGLTGLPNRVLLADLLAQAVAQADREEHRLALLFIDLDYFKTINDSLGHEVGDKLLKQMATRLGECMRKSDFLARLGGDEFLMALSGVKHGHDAAQVAQKIVASLARPCRVGEHVLHTTCSIGISNYPDDGKDAQTLMRSADMAMYHAKETGRNHYQFFSRQMDARATDRLKLGNALQGALKREEFELHYQPYINLVSGQISGVEALIRWRHPELGLLPPGRFIPLAEDTGLIVPIGKWVLRTACKQMKVWQSRSIKRFHLAVNLSARQFRQANLIQQIIDTLKETGMQKDALELEITESMAMQDPEKTKEILHKLKNMGIGLTIDDFGTGYSSLSYLKGFPIRSLKIDRSFIDGIPNDNTNVAITKATIALAKVLDLNVIAEGIETEAQQSFLTHAGCHGGQGYLFAQPLSASRVEALLQ